MNHRAFLILLSILTTAVVIGSGAYLEWPETPSQRENQPPFVGGPNSDSPGSATSSTLGQNIPRPRLSPPPVESAEFQFGPVKLWVGLKNSDDQGTQFDLRAEVYKNNVLVAQGQTLCVTGATRNPDKAKQVSTGLQPNGENSFAPGDVLSLKLLTRIGTTPNGAKCPGPGGSHATSTGLRLYFDAATHPSALTTTLSPDPPTNYFLNSKNGTFVLTHVSPTAQGSQFKDSPGLNLARGNPWSQIGIWSLVQPILALGTGVGFPGDVVAITVILDSERPGLSALGGDIEFDPHAFSIRTCTINPAISDKSLSTNLVQPNLERFIVFGLNQNLLPDGVLFTCEFVILPGASTSALTLPTISAADPQGNNIPLTVKPGRIVVLLASSAPPVLAPTPTKVNSDAPLLQPEMPRTIEFSSVVRVGDLNGDGVVNVLDVQLEVNVIFGVQTDPAIVSRADLNADGARNVLDVQILVNIALGTVIDTTTQLVVATQGGIITLQGGSSLSIPAGALPSDQLVTLSLRQVAQDQPPSTLVGTVGPALTIAFAPGLAAAPSLANRRTSLNQSLASPSQDILAVLNPGTNPLPGADGSAPLAELVDLANKAIFVGIPGNSNDPIATFTMSSSLLANTREIRLSRANVRPIDTAPLPVAGSRLWNPMESRWITSTSAFDPTKRTLVLVHGMISSVEEAWGSGAQTCVNEIMKTGGFEQVLGFDYNWSADIEQSGDDLATFLQSLKVAGLNSVDIVAHSEGVPVALSAVSRSNPVRPDITLRVGTMFLLGGPITGTPVASLQTAANIGLVPLTTAIFNIPYIVDSLVKSVIPANGILTLRDMLQGRFAAGLLPGSNALDTILSAMSNRMDQPGSNISETRLITVAATTPIPGLEILKTLLCGGQEFDGVICLPSATGDLSGLRIAATLTLPVDHKHLECDPQVIQAMRNAPVISPAFLAFYSEEGGTNPALQSITISNNGSTPFNFDVTTTPLLFNSPGVPWLNVSQSSGSLPPGQSMTISAGVNPLALPPCRSAPLDCDTVDVAGLTISDATNSQTVVVALRFNSLSGVWTGPYTLIETFNDPCGAVTDSGNLSPRIFAKNGMTSGGTYDATGVFVPIGDPCEALLGPRLDRRGLAGSTTDRIFTGRLNFAEFNSTVNGNTLAGIFLSGFYRGIGTGTFTLAKQLPEIIVSPASLSFTATPNSPIPTSQDFTVNNTGSTFGCDSGFCEVFLGYNIVASVSWLRIPDADGLLDPNVSKTHEVSVDTTGLPPGSYIGTIVVVDPFSAIEPKAINVMLIVNP